MKAPPPTGPGLTRSQLKIGYLAHDLADPAVARRVLMLKDGGAGVSIAGFRRGRHAHALVGGVSAREIGRTQDARFLGRILAILRASCTAFLWARSLNGVTLLIARNLEMLALARAVRPFLKPRPRLVYEVLDIHRLLLAPGLMGRTFRWVERTLAKPVGKLLLSSPAFRDNYYVARRQVSAPALILENKVLAEPSSLPSERLRPPPPPWRIGWFGMIRCSQSLHRLRRLCERLPGLVEVDLRGRISYSEFEDFERTVSETPGMRYLGPYSPDDLADAYSSVHFAWAIDFFEAGLNSSWLLPNRLYESQWFGAVPLAQAEVETGRWLSRRGVGVRFEDLDAELAPFFQSLDAERHLALLAQMRAVPREALASGHADHLRLLRELDVDGEPERFARLGGASEDWPLKDF